MSTNTKDNDSSSSSSNSNNVAKTPTLTDAPMLASLYPYLTPQQLFDAGRVDALLGDIPHVWVAESSGYCTSLTPGAVPDIKYHYNLLSHGHKERYVVLACHTGDVHGLHVKYHIAYGDVDAITALYPSLTPQQLVALGQVEVLLGDVPHVWVASSSGYCASLTPKAVPDIRSHYVRSAQDGSKCRVVLACHSTKAEGFHVKYHIATC